MAQGRARRGFLVAPVRTSREGFHAEDAQLGNLVVLCSSQEGWPQARERCTAVCAPSQEEWHPHRGHLRLRRRADLAGGMASRLQAPRRRLYFLAGGMARSGTDGGPGRQVAFLAGGMAATCRSRKPRRAPSAPSYEEWPVPVQRLVDSLSVHPRRRDRPSMSRDWSTIWVCRPRKRDGAPQSTWIAMTFPLAGGMPPGTVV